MPRLVPLKNVVILRRLVVKGATALAVKINKETHQEIAAVKHPIVNVVGVANAVTKMMNKIASEI